MSANKVYFIVALVMVGLFSVIGLGVSILAYTNQQLYVSQLQDSINTLDDRLEALEAEHADTSDSDASGTSEEGVACITEGNRIPVTNPMPVCCEGLVEQEVEDELLGVGPMCVVPE